MYMSNSPFKHNNVDIVFLSFHVYNDIKIIYMNTFALVSDILYSSSSHRRSGATTAHSLGTSDIHLSFHAAACSMAAVPIPIVVYCSTTISFIRQVADST